MKRRTFLNAGCTCGVLSLLGASQLIAVNKSVGQQDEKKKHVPQEMNEEQVKNILKFIDSSEDESVKENIFSQLGYECFYSRKLDNWIGGYVDDVQEFLDRVNVEHKSRYWEKLEYNADHTALTLVGKKVEGCACAFADCPHPPKSLCHYCCKNFQQELFGMLLGRKVEVEITKSFLLGDESCDTVIYLV